MSNKTPYALVKAGVSKHRTTYQIIASLLKTFPGRNPKKLKVEAYSLIYRFRHVRCVSNIKEPENKTFQVVGVKEDTIDTNGLLNEAYLDRLVQRVNCPSVPMPKITRLSLD